MTSRWLRQLFALLFVLACTIGGASFAHAQPSSTQLGAGVGAASPALQVPPPEQSAPLDTPRVMSDVVVPEVPAEMETRNLGWMRISYPPATRERIEPVIAGAELVKEHLSARFGQPVLSNVEIRIARSWEEMAKLAPAAAPPPKYASGVAYSPLHLVLVTLVAPRTYEAVNLEETVRHELSHIALSDAVGEAHVPRWFQEGVAIHESGELGMTRATDLSQASLWGTLIPLADLDRFPADGYGVSVAYAESGDFVRFLMREEDAPRFLRLVQRVRDGQRFEAAMTDAYGSDMRKLEYQWKQDVSRRYSFWPSLLTGSFLWVLVVGALSWGYIKRRRRQKQIMARWAKEEAYEDALIAARRAVLEQDAPAHVQLVSLPVVQHEGRTHTLH